MRSFEPLIFIFTCTTFLLLPILTITALPLDPTPISFSSRPLVRKPHHTLEPHLLVPSRYKYNRTTPLVHGRRARFRCPERCCLTGCCREKHATANRASLIETSPPKYSKRMESFLTVLDPFLTEFAKFICYYHHHHLDEVGKEEEKKKMGSNATRAAASGGGDKKEITRRWIGEEDEDEDEEQKESKDDKDVPLVRIFPNGSFSPFTPEETIEFYILRNAQGQGPDLRDPPLEHPAPPGVEQTPKPSKEGSVYDESRTCDSSGEWCKMPVEGSELIAGIGIGSCTYFEPEGIWGKTVTYLVC